MESESWTILGAVPVSFLGVIGTAMIGLTDAERTGFLQVSEIFHESEADASYVNIAILHVYCRIEHLIRTSRG